MLEKIELFKQQENLLKSELRDWVKDKSITLDERWSVFFKSELGDHSSGIEDFINLDSDDIASVMDHHRHEIVYLEDISEYGIESIKNENDYNEFREDVLNKFIKSYEWDW